MVFIININEKFVKYMLILYHFSALYSFIIVKQTTIYELLLFQYFLRLKWCKNLFSFLQIHSSAPVFCPQWNCFSPKMRHDVNHIFIRAGNPS